MVPLVIPLRLVSTFPPMVSLVLPGAIMDNFKLMFIKTSNLYTLKSTRPDQNMYRIPVYLYIKFRIVSRNLSIRIGKDKGSKGGGVMLLVHKDISHMHITELENDSESVWVKVFANKTCHFVASWYTS